MVFVFYSPTKVVFGRGSVGLIGEEVSKLGSKALVVTGRSFARRTGLLSRVVDSLRRGGVDAVVFDRVLPNPPIENVAEGTDLAARSDVDVVVGLGGGSAMDAAKAIAAAVELGGDVRAYLYPSTVPRALPVVAIPTTCGTGSEVTKYSILTDTSARRKVAMVGEALIPRVALVDPDTIRTLPRNLVAWTGLDALSHALEAFVSRASNEISDLFAVEAAALVVENLAEAYRGSRDAEERLHLVATLAGVAINTGGTVLVHALGYRLTAVHGIHHGLANALFLPYAIRPALAADSVREKLPRLLGRLGLDSLDEFFRVLCTLLDSLGIPRSLGEAGVPRSDFSGIVEDALSYRRNLENMPVDVDRQLVEEVVREAFEGRGGACAAQLGG